MLTEARFDLFTRNAFLGGVHDAQARALLHGHWDVPASTLGIEAFKIDGRYYTYFGPWPTLLRMPVVALTHRLDGRLTVVSMIVACVVALAATSSVHRQLREALRPDAPFGRSEALWVGAFQFAVAMGSVVTFLGSRPLVYHEMELWGVAGALTTAATSIAFLRRQSVRSALLLGGAATITLLSRPSVGFGAVVTVGLVFLGALRGRTVARDRRIVVALAAAAAVPVLLYGATNVARFGGPFSLPLDKQVFTTGDPATGLPADTLRQAALAANGDSLFGVKFAPTTLLQYGRPNALRFQSSFPWVNFPRWRAHVLGGVVFDTIDRSSSIPASMPGFTLLACFGVVALVRGRRGSPLHPSRIVLPSVVGGAAGTVFVITIAYVAQRYLADFFPPLLVLALVGVQALALRPNRRVVTAVIAVCIVGTWIGFGLARVYQHNLRPGDPDWGRGTRTISSTR